MSQTKEDKLAYDRRWREENREKVLAIRKRHYQKHREKILAKRKRYREENREEKAAYGKRYYQTERGRQSHYRGKAKRRALIKDAFVEVVDRLVVAGRDGWKCQAAICKMRTRAIGKTLKSPHHRSLHIDHILPLSKGGKHSYANVQAMHLRCNQCKSDKMETQDQQRLF